MDGVVTLFDAALTAQPFSLIKCMTPHSEDPSSSCTTLQQIIHAVSAISEPSYSEPMPAQRSLVVDCGLVGVCGAVSGYITISWTGK